MPQALLRQSVKASTDLGDEALPYQDVQRTAALPRQDLVDGHTIAAWKPELLREGIHQAIRLDGILALQAARQHVGGFAA